MLTVLLTMSFKGQQLNEKKIWTFFKNERYRNRFTEKQKNYLKDIFKFNNDPTNYSEILTVLLTMSFKGQQLNKKKICTFFNNQRNQRNY